MLLSRIIAAAVLNFCVVTSTYLQKRACPELHVFGARETTVSPGYGSSGPIVNNLLAAHPGATSEAISYPACGGQASCGGIQYAESVRQGTAAVLNQIRQFAAQCPQTKLVLVGYSQGGEIFDNALCNLSTITSYNIKAAIFMGDPRYRSSCPFNVGTCTAQGFDARPVGQQCGAFNSRVQSYCDAADPYCCNGNDAATHQSYGNKYGQAAVNFVNSHLA